MQSLQDSYGRRLNGLRISVTQKCNLSCPHCHREGQPPARTEMTPEEIGKITSVASSLGVRKVKITGGEPLLREDICDIVAAIRPHMAEISLTTNGILLDRYASDLKKAGLDRINISIHSLSGESMIKIVGKDCVGEVKSGIAAAREAGLNPIKLNMVVLNGINHTEIPEMIEFASRSGAILELIELATDRSGCNEDYFKRHHYALGEIESNLASRASSISYNELHRRAQYRLTSNGGEAVVEIVRSMHNSVFCSNCTRLRLTSDGILKGCLYENNGHLDVLGAVRSGAGQEKISELFLSCLKTRKPYWM
ncbi:MAG: GTP 3',8-cyclase MoaA [Thermoplasmata archaeon]